jgi:N-carbamoylputrescine amidase
VRKQSRPAYEGWVFRSSDEPKTIDTPLGRIGIGICADNYMRRFFERIQEEKPELLLMPHSAPFKVPDDGQIRRGVSEIGPFYARSFGIPTVVSNKAVAPNSFTSPVPTGGEPLELQFPGMSTITDSDGEVRGHLHDVEGFVCAEVILASERRRNPPPPTHHYWSYTARNHADAVAAVYIDLERLGTRAYADARDQRLVAIAELRAGYRARARYCDGVAPVQLRSARASAVALSKPTSCATRSTV